MNTRTIALPMLCLLLPAPSFSQQAASNFRQSNPLQDTPAIRDEWRKAYKDFNPGPSVAERIEELKAREREVRDLWSVSKLSQRELSIEIARNQIHRHPLLYLVLVAGKGGSVSDLVVVQANTREIQKVFPSGKFPTDSLQANTIYAVVPGSARKIRCLTLYQWSSGGPNFAVLAREVEP
jgi:hypothetical protein